jgi:hypothetical protein
MTKITFIYLPHEICAAARSRRQSNHHRQYSQTRKDDHCETRYSPPLTAVKPTLPPNDPFPIHQNPHPSSPKKKKITTHNPKNFQTHFESTKSNPRRTHNPTAGLPPLPISPSITVGTSLELLLLSESPSIP